MTDDERREAEQLAKTIYLSRQFDTDSWDGFIKGYEAGRKLLRAELYKLIEPSQLSAEELEELERLDRE